MPGYLNILLALKYDTAFDRLAFTGIAAVAQAHGNTLFHMKDMNESFADSSKRHKVDGIVLSSDYQLSVEEAIATGKPCVNIANFPAGQDKAPIIGTDDKAIGELIAEHFLSRGFKHFASFSDVQMTYFAPRNDAFANAIREAGFQCHVGPPVTRHGSQSPESKWDDHAAAWLSSLPKPLALMAPYDAYAREAALACKAAGLRVPEDVSIIGVDNDEMLCMTVWPQLSSVATRGDQIGYQAMQLLRQLLSGEAKPPDAPILIKPGGIVVRGSSSETAVADTEVAAAIGFIRANCMRPIRVGDVVDHIAVSRRTLERRFVHSLGRNIADEIRRAHVERARKLLIETDLPLQEVARRSGLLRQQQLSRVIKEETGQTPRALRATFRFQH